ncbi:cytochrome P450 [Streptomyces sp. NPDC048527]|uniref:cytochrome P450 n=1 Tax=Streptomyces sp. NPDC048527 TaxID=3365568 RepID=UPI003724A68E
MSTEDVGPALCPVHDYPFEAPGAFDPPPLWAQLRQENPVSDISLPSGDSALLLTRYEDVKATLADPRWSRVLDPAQGAARVPGVFGSGDRPRGEDQPRLRRLISKSFTAKRANDMRPRLTEITEELVRDLQNGTNPGDLQKTVSIPLTVRAICELLGVPEADRDQFSRWSELFLSMTKYTQSEIEAGRAEFIPYMMAHVETKRSHPADDLISELTAISDADDGRLSNAELINVAMALLIAGHESTSSAITKMLAMLLADRSRWETLLADRGLVRTAVEEALRIDSNAGFGMPRFITEETELSGVLVKAGSTVVNSIAAANRDPEVFDHPERMDLARTPNSHMAFGIGPHVCLGQALARAQMQICLDVLLERLPGLDLAVPVAKLNRRVGLVVGGLDELSVTW